MLRYNIITHYLIIWLISAILILSCTPLLAQGTERPAPEIATGTTQNEAVTADKYMAVTSNPHATKAAYDVLDNGGTAADAAIAAQLVLGLVEPQSSGLGGGAFVLYYDAASKKLTSLDGRETAPQNATPNLFLKEDGTPMDFHDAVIGGRSVGVPGTPALLERLHQRFGKASWNSLFDDAINLAKAGFEISPRLAKMIEADKGSLDRYEPARSYFYNNSGILKNPNYMKSLKGFRDNGNAYFYDINAPVNIVKDIVHTVQNAKDNPGLLTADDLADYTIKQRDPICGYYKGYKICSMGEPSSGALTMLQILGMLERFDLTTLGPDSPRSIHLIAEASRLAFADRNMYMADSDFIDTPGLSLLDKNYLKERSKLINHDRIIQNIAPGTPPNWKEDRAEDPNHTRPGTSHISIVDAYGNILSMTTTIEGGFGSRLMVGGFLLNNELTDFSFVPEKYGHLVANRVTGDKRPRSSMSPTIIFAPDGSPFLVIGSAGGSRIIGFVVQRIIAVIDWNMSIHNAVNMFHFLARSDTLELEHGLEHLKKPMEELGHNVSVREMNSGLTAIRLKNGTLTAVADPRREGRAMGK